MNPNRAFYPLLGLGVIGLALPTALGARFAPCLALGSACWLETVDAACRLLERAGLHPATALVGAALLAGSCFTSGRLIWSAWRQLQATRRFLATLQTSTAVTERERLTQAAERVGVSQAVTLIAGQTPRSCCYGFRRPHILVSEGLIRALEPHQLEAVLWHERRHLENRDPLRLFLGRLVRDSLPWLPLVGALERYFELLTELAADRQAVRIQQSPAGLAGALYRLLTSGGDASGLGAVAGLSQTSVRIDHLLDPSSAPRLQLRLWEWGATTLLATLAFCLLFL